MDLQQGELEWLSNHMGHELQIHREFHHLHESTVEIAKVGRLLMAVDAGELAKYKGKKFEDITLDLEQDESEEIGLEVLCKGTVDPIPFISLWQEDRE